jgi:hypothetical protein
MTIATWKSVCMLGRGEIGSEGVEGSSEVYHHQSVGITSYSRDEAVVPDVITMHSNRSRKML